MKLPIYDPLLWVILVSLAPGELGVIFFYRLNSPSEFRWQAYD